MILHIVKSGLWEHSVISDRRGESYMAKVGAFIVLEGIDGSGKTTQAAYLAGALQAKGYDVVLTKEPGGTPFGEGIKPLITENPQLAPETRLALLMAARAEHVRKVVKPALDAGRIVVCDRFLMTTMAYQTADGIPPKIVMAMHTAVTVGIEPDITVYLDIPVKVAADRAGYRQKATGEQVSVFEAREGFMTKVSGMYNLLARGVPVDGVRIKSGELLRVDGSADVDAIKRTIETGVIKSLYTMETRRKAASLAKLVGLNR